MAMGQGPPSGSGPAAPGGLYRSKPSWQRLLQPLTDRLVARHVSADLLTGLALVAAALAGVCLAASDALPALLLAVPFLAAIRLVLNLLDGQVARGSGMARPMGEVWNELADRVADVLMIGALAFVAAVGPLLASAATVAALLASYVGIASRAAGAPRQYGGVMSKPGRMVVLAVAAPFAFVLAEGWPLALGAVVIALGASVTAGQRLAAADRDLSGVGD